MTGLVMNVDVANHDMGRQDTTYYYQMATDRRQPPLPMPLKPPSPLPSNLSSCSSQQRKGEHGWCGVVWCGVVCGLVCGSD